MSDVEAERLENEELDVDYTMEAIDEEEVLREELELVPRVGLFAH